MLAASLTQQLALNAEMCGMLHNTWGFHFSSLAATFESCLILLCFKLWCVCRANLTVEKSVIFHVRFMLNFLKVLMPPIRLRCLFGFRTPSMTDSSRLVTRRKFGLTQRSRVKPRLPSSLEESSKTLLPPWSQQNLKTAISTRVLAAPQETFCVNGWETRTWLLQNWRSSRCLYF